MGNRNNNQRIIIGMLDGFSLDYYYKSKIPFMKKIACEGFFKEVESVFPSVTNVNNVSIGCGAWPKEHGISSNSYYDPETNTAKYMNSKNFIKIKTIFERAQEWGIKSAMLTCKKKTAELFNNGMDICIAAEDPPQSIINEHGHPPDIYSCEINYWIWEVAIRIIKEHPEIGLIYVHTTDYPMHKWSEIQYESQKHLNKIDQLIEKMHLTDPSASILLTADHGMDFKKRCYDLSKLCDKGGYPVRFVLSPERDYYEVHHRNFTGCAWIWLNNEDDHDNVVKLLRDINGVEEVLDAEEAATRFNIEKERIGDLIVLGDADTMFGDMNVAYEELPKDYRAHGSLYEMNVPLIIYNYNHPLPSDEFFSHNFDLTRFLFRT